MGRIHLLEDDIINKIAAGEVVERPASVLKELLENSVDAGATEITVDLDEGGKKLISVQDNGAGIGPDDVEMSLKRHATSKIKALDDLFQVESLGFRGEALASVASVSRFQICSRQHDSRQGVRLQHQNGKSQVSDWDGTPGTRVSVEELFFNVPARLKFMKSSGSEFAHCMELVQSLALSRPEITLVLRHNGKEKLRVAAVPGAEPGGARDLFGEQVLRARVTGVWGKELADCLIYVCEEDKWGRFEGFISPPGVEKATAKNIITFVNRRWVRDQVLRYGLLRGYHSHLLKGRFPQVTGFYSCDPALVDANVHPRKQELRFQYAAEVQSLIALAIRNGIRKGDWASGGAGDLEESAERSGGGAVQAKSGPGARTFKVSASSYKSAASSTRAPRAELRESRSSGGRKAGDASVRPESSPRLPEAVSEDREYDAFHQPAPREEKIKSELSPGELFSRAAGEYAGEAGDGGIPWEDLQFQGCLFKCYLMFESRDKRLLCVDQHAFHERILFEKLLKNQALLQAQQPLLVPEVVELRAEEAETVRQREEQIREAGFWFQWLDSCNLEVSAVPSLLSGKAVDQIFVSLAGGELAGVGSQEAVGMLSHHILSTIACHAAVRAGEELDMKDIRELISEAASVDFFHNCPHGRRVLKWFRKSEVEGWFDRH